MILICVIACLFLHGSQLRCCALKVIQLPLKKVQQNPLNSFSKVFHTNPQQACLPCATGFWLGYSNKPTARCLEDQQDNNRANVAENPLRCLSKLLAALPHLEQQHMRLEMKRQQREEPVRQLDINTSVNHNVYNRNTGMLKEEGGCI
ncbi:hypothetical protein GOODEAATRI_005308 [Goodea atripinnis]|uniref:Uncharacterized protein n=1 Tax=Goodea atripinnis TaxID=208336 RepID=A0ABV0PVW5_9TELE